MKQLYLRTLLFLIAGLCLAQTATVRSVQGKYPEGKSYYLYQSTLRALLSSSGNDFNALVNGVDKLTVVQIDKKQIQMPNGEFGRISASLMDEGFAEMLAMSGPEGRFGWYSEAGEEPEHVVGLVDSKDQLFLLDLIGTVDVSMLYRMRASDLADFSKLFEAMNFTK